MGINLAEIEFIVLSHGHHDHFGGLTTTAKAISKKMPKEEMVKPARYVETKQPYLLAEV